MQTWTDVGITIAYGATGEMRTTCPRCSASRRKSRDGCLAVNVDKGTWVCHHCGWKGCLYGRQQVLTRPAPSPLPVQPDERKRTALRRIWGEAYPITAADPVHTYLCRRGIGLSLCEFPTVIRHHPHLAYRDADGVRSYHPAMLARVDDRNGRAVTLHRTYLTRDGKKANVPTVKKLMSPTVPGATHGGAIRIYPAGETLAITEGIETGLAVRSMTGLPVWAAICAAGLARVTIPPEISLVVICADNDIAGQGAAKALARRCLAEQRRVKILTPERPGADWADLLEVAHG